MTQEPQAIAGGCNAKTCRKDKNILLFQQSQTFHSQSAGTHKTIGQIIEGKLSIRADVGPPPVRGHRDIQVEKWHSNANCG